MIRTHQGPWQTCYNIFEFGFDFALILELLRNVIRIWLLLKEQSGENLLMDEHLHHIKEGGGVHQA